MKRKKILFRMQVFLAAAFGVTVLSACGGNATQTPTTLPTEQAASPEPQQQQSSDAITEVAYSQLQADIVIIGAGGAGMSAALEAHYNGADNIVLLEKMPQTGGNTTLATGGMNAANTRYQVAEDSVELMMADALAAGQDLNDPELISVFAERSADAIHWVNDLGAGLTSIIQMGGSSVPRTHRPEGGMAVGPTLVTVLNQRIAEAGIPVMLNTEATQILVDDDNSVTGVVVQRDGETLVIETTAIIIATGGFGANPEMIQRFNPALEGFGTTNQVSALGGGINLAADIGAALVDMEQIQTHPTVEPTTSTMYTEAVRGSGAVLVNTEGVRFVNELGTRDVVSNAILEQPDGFAFLVFDSSVRAGLAAIETYLAIGILAEADSIAGLAEEIGVDPAVLEATINEYIGFVASGNDEAFGRPATSMLSTMDGARFYAGVTIPAVHHTMGGIQINTNAEVMTEDGGTINGLFAAGEVAGGVHGAERLGGNALADIVIFGRIAAQNAVEFVEQNGGFTERTIIVETETVAAVPEVQGDFTDGVFEGVGRGHNGEMAVTVTVEGNNIVAIAMGDHRETPGFYELASETIANEVIRTQSTQVDLITGATATSAGIIEAIRDAVSE